MKKEINPKIEEAINASKDKESIKEFLKTLLEYEEKVSEQRSPRYKEIYDNEIQKFAEKWKAEL